MRADEIHPGDVIAGKYRVRAILARNPTLLVEAFHVEFDQRVIIKLLLAGTGDEKEIERFRREARTLAKLETEHAARIIDVGTQPDGSFYLVRQHVEGEDLAAYMQAYGQRPLAEAVLLVLQAAEAVSEAHSHGIVLREISPTALTVTRRPGGMPSVKITDFGTAKLMKDAVAPTGASSLTATALFGLSPYSSPELVRKAKSVDARADVWSLGAVLYALLSGRAPFEGDTARLMLAITREDPMPLAQLRRDLPREVDQVISWALAKDLDGRFKNVYAFAHALTPFASQEGLVLIERIGLITHQRRGAGGQAMPPPPIAAASQPGVQELSSAHLEEFAEISGEEEATVSLSGPSNAAAMRAVAAIQARRPSIPPPPPSQPTPWVSGERPRLVEPFAAQRIPRIPPAPESTASFTQRYDTMPPPPAAAADRPSPAYAASALSGQAVSQRAEPKKGPDTRILWGAVAAMAVMLPVVLLLLLRDSGKSSGTADTSSPVAQNTAGTTAPANPPAQPPTPTATTTNGSMVLNADATKPTPSAVASTSAAPVDSAAPAAPGNTSAVAVNTGPTPKPTTKPTTTADKPKDDPPASGTGTLLAIASGGSCAFSVDGGGRGSGSSLSVKLPAGSHTVTCAPSSGAAKSRGVKIKPGETSMLTFKL